MSRIIRSPKVRDTLLVAYVILNLSILFIGFALYLTPAGHGTGLWQGVATSLLASGITALVLTGYIWASNDQLRKHQDQASSLRAEVEATLEKSRKYGLIDVHPSVYPHVTDYLSSLANDSERIDILGVSLWRIYQDMRVQFFSDLSRYTRVRIILLHPSFPGTVPSVADCRDIEEDRLQGTIAHEVELFLEKFRAVPATGPNGGSFQIRLAHTLPTIHYFRLDSHIFWGPFLMNKDGGDSFTTAIDSSGTVAVALAEHFEQVWRRSEDFLTFINSRKPAK